MIHLPSAHYRRTVGMHLMRSSLLRSTAGSSIAIRCIEPRIDAHYLHTRMQTCVQEYSKSATLMNHSLSLIPSSSTPYRRFSTIPSSPASTTAANADPATATAIATPGPEQPKAAAADKPSASVRFKKYFEKNRLKWYNFALAGAVTYGMYRINDFGFDLINFYLEQREADAAHLAYLTGIAATGVSYLLYRATRRFYALNASRMYREVLRAVFNSAEVQEKLGSDVRKKTLQRMQRYGRNKLFENTGKANTAAVATTSSSLSSSSSSSSSLPSSVVPPNLRLVSFIPASLSVRKSKEAWMKYVQPRRLQFIIHVEGSNGHGLVQAEVEQTLRGDFDDTNIIVVDLLDKGEQIQVRKHYDTSKRKQDLANGDEEQTGVIKGRPLLSQKVVKY